VHQINPEAHINPAISGEARNTARLRITALVGITPGGENGRGYRKRHTHRAAVSVKVWVRGRFGQLAAALAGDGRTARPGLLADQLSLVMEGTYASAQALSADGPARHARAVAESLLDVS
jgi:hypothetical protein